MVRRNRAGIGRDWLWRAAACLFVLSLLLWMAGRRVAPLVREYAVNRAQTLAGEAMTAAVNAVLARGECGYDMLTVVSRDESGAVRSVETNAAAVNRLNADVITALGDTLAQDDFCTMRLPLGNATGNVFFMGRGPTITVHIQQNGAATTQLNSVFADAGINQTVHRLELTLTFRAVVLVAGMSEPIETTGTFLIAETVIVGTVPDAFANINR